MKKLLEAADSYVKGLCWQDVAMIKICLSSLGIIIGLLLPKKWRKVVLIAALLAFTATYVPLMARFIPALKEALCGECVEA